MNSKICTKCKIEKDVTEFHANKQAKDGKASNCKCCRKISQENWRLKSNYNKSYYDKNSDIIKKRASQYKKDNPEKVKQVRREYYQNNRATIDSKNKKWAKDNRERSREIKKKYEKNNPEVKLKSSIDRRAKERLSTPEWSESSKIRTLMQKCKELSRLTGKVYHIDHIEPIRGKNVCGLHVWANLQILEDDLNYKKSNKEGYIVRLDINGDLIDG